VLTIYNICLMYTYVVRLFVCLGNTLFVILFEIFTTLNCPVGRDPEGTTVLLESFRKYQYSETTVMQFGLIY
jgi:hypothetical protein